MNSLRNFLRTMGGTLGLTGMVLALALPQFSRLAYNRIFLTAIAQRVGSTSQHPINIDLF